MIEKQTEIPAYDVRRYVIKNPWTVPSFYAVGILAWLATMYGFILFFQFDPLYWILVAPLVAIFSAYHLLSYGINLFYKPFDVKRHARKVRAFWKRRENREPAVDVFLPVCGEPSWMLERTFKGVRSIHADRKTVYVLDDRGQEAVRRLTEKYGFVYVSRPDKGRMKKAGNLEYGIEHSRGEFFAIFDADFVPHEAFVRELLPYMSDRRVAIVQSPQYFKTDATVHARSPLEYGAGHVQEDFYRVIQQARNTFGGAICVGSNALYRRSAVETIGGITQIEHSEDVHTGFHLVNRGFKILYVPLVLAVGLCPADLHAYFHQQHRWCSGTLSLMLNKEFWASRLSLGQKLCYTSGLLYYLAHGVSLILGFQIFLLLFRHYEGITLWQAIPFFPYMIFSFILLPLFRITKPKVGTLVARQSHNFSYGHALVRSVVDRPFGWKPLGWKPTGIAKSRLSPAYVRLLHAKAFYFASYLGLTAVAIALHRFPVWNVAYAAVLFWIFYALLVNGLVLVHSYQTTLGLLDEDGKTRWEKTRWIAAHAGPYAALTAVLFFFII